MSQLKSLTLFESLATITDPRIERTKEHKLVDILVIAVCATICGAERWEEIAEFGRAKQEWFAGFLALPNGIASHDTFRRVFLLLQPSALQMAFLAWVQAAVRLTGGQVVNLDGKHLRGSKKKPDGKDGLRMVSAWASEQRVVLGQVKTHEKSNEITAIPELLSLLDVSGCIVTIDAMGCQTAIVEQLVDQQADYVVSLKGNQGNLHKDIKDYFYWAEKSGFKEIAYDYCESVEKGHGRIEVRRCWVTEDIAWLAGKEKWAGLRSIVMVEAEREVIGQAATTERRYFISSLAAKAKDAVRCVRGHWSIENSLHWCLDIGFREDGCRTRTGHGPENLAIVRHIALNLLKQEKNCKLGIKGKRLKAGWDERYLLKVLNN